MLATIVAAFRDGLEASILIATLLGLVEKSGQKEKGKLVISGSLLGITAVLCLFLLASLTGRSLEALIGNFEIFEGVTLISSGILIVLTALFLEKKAVSLRASLGSRIQKAIETQSDKLIFAIPFLIVLTEGTEVALASSKNLISGDLSSVIGAIILGLALAVTFIYLIFKTEIGLNLKLPTILTLIKAILLLTSLSLLNHGIHELTEAGIFKVEEYRFSYNSTLNEVLKFLFGVKGKISILQLAVTSLYTLWAVQSLRRLANRTEKSSPTT